MRAFVAIPLDAPVKDALVRVARTLRPAGANVRWVDRETMHVTLKFLGDIDSVRCARMQSLLGDIRLDPVELDVRGVGYFGGRVVWVACRGPLDALASAIDRAAVTIGASPAEHPFHAHITIGRSRSARIDGELARQIELRKDEPIGRQTAKAFVMYKSTLTPNGPIHDVVESFMMKA